MLSVNFVNSAMRKVCGKGYIESQVLRQVSRSEDEDLMFLSLNHVIKQSFIIY